MHTAGSQVLSGNGPAASTALPNSFGSMDTTVSYTDKPGRHILQEFLRKVLKLAANRSHDLCGRLDLEDANREEIETQVQAPAHGLLLLAMLSRSSICSSLSSFSASALMLMLATSPKQFTKKRLPRICCCTCSTAAAK